MYLLERLRDIQTDGQTDRDRESSSLLVDSPDALRHQCSLPGSAGEETGARSKARHWDTGRRHLHQYTPALTMSFYTIIVTYEIANIPLAFYCLLQLLRISLKNLQKYASGVQKPINCEKKPACNSNWGLRTVALGLLLQKQTIGNTICAGCLSVLLRIGQEAAGPGAVGVTMTSPVPRVLTGGILLTFSLRAILLDRKLDMTLCVCDIKA